MKTKATTRSRSRDSFDQNLLGYSLTSRGALLAAPVAAATLLVAPVADAQTNVTGIYLEQGVDAPLFPLTNPAFGANGSGSVHFKAGNTLAGLRGAMVYAQNQYHGSFRLRITDPFAYTKIAATRPQPGTLRFQTHSTQGRGVEIRNLGNGVNIAGAVGPIGPSAAPDHSGFFVNGRVTNYGTGFHTGGFAPVGPNAQVSGYIGFWEGGFGWLKIRVTNNAEGVAASLTFVEASDGFYGEVGDSSLTTPSAIPEPASVPGGLGLLALGAAGVREMRRRRKLAA